LGCGKEKRKKISQILHRNRFTAGVIIQEGATNVDLLLKILEMVSNINGFVYSKED
jgi:hypothetical protein